MQKDKFGNYIPNSQVKGVNGEYNYLDSGYKGYSSSKTPSTWDVLKGRTMSNIGLGNYATGLTPNNNFTMSDAYYNPNGGAYTPEMTAQAMKDYGLSNDAINTVYDDGASIFGGSEGFGLGSVGNVLGGINALAGLGSVWAAFEGVDAQKDANAEARANNIANFNLSADQFNAQIDRANNINGQIAAANKDAAHYRPAKVIANVERRS